MAKKKDKHGSAVQAKLICNPGAGDHPDATARLEQAVRCLDSCGISVDVALAKPSVKATPIAEAAVKEGYKLVIAMGGDGTIEAVARGLAGSKTVLGMIPGGTFNNVAHSLGLPLDLEEACRLVATGTKRRIDMGRIKTKAGDKMPFFEVAAIGLVAALYPKGKNIAKGKLGHLVDVLDTLVHYQTPKVTLIFDDDSHIEVETLLVTVSNTPVFGAEFLIAPEAALDDGLLDVCVYPNFSKADLIAYFSRVAKDGHSEDQRVQRYRVHRVKIKSDPRQDVMADGIMLGQETVTIRALPAALRVITGEQLGLAQEAMPTSEQLPVPAAPATAPASEEQLR